MTVNHKPSDIERMKREAYDILYRMHVYYLITNQAMELYGLFCSKDIYNSYRLEEIDGYRKLLSKVWLKLREKDTLLFKKMIDLDFNSLEIQSVMDYAESRYHDNYAIMETYGIVLGDFEKTEYRINSIIY